MTQPQLTPVGACETCGKRHPQTWHHTGYCTNCHGRPVMTSKRDAQMCQECFDALWKAAERQPGKPSTDDAPDWMRRIGFID